MVVHEKFIATHDMRIKIPGHGEVCHLRKPFFDASPNARIDVSANSRLIVYYLLGVVGFLERSFISLPSLTSTSDRMNEHDRTNTAHSFATFEFWRLS
jgi:hypothetical protein